MVPHPRWPAGFWKWSHHWTSDSISIIPGGEWCFLLGRNRCMPRAWISGRSRKVAWIKTNFFARQQHTRVPPHLWALQAPATAKHHLLAIPCLSDALGGVQVAAVLELRARRAQRRLQPQHHPAEGRAATCSRGVKKGEMNKIKVLLKTLSIYAPHNTHYWLTARSRHCLETVSYWGGQRAWGASVPSACPSHSLKKQHC